MSDYKELLERTARYSVLSDEASRDTYMLHSALHAVLAKLDATESERKAWENTAGCLRTDLEYMTRRAEQAEARLAKYERWQGDAEKVANEVAVKWISEYEPALAPIVSLGQSFVLQTLTAAALVSFAAQAAARQREEDANSRQDLHIIFDGPPGPEAGRFVECETADGKSINAGTWAQREDGFWCLRIAAAIRKGET